MMAFLAFHLSFFPLLWRFVMMQTDRGNCTFTNRVDGTALSYVDRVVNATNEETCRNACRLEMLFTCRSISFINQGRDRMSCYLSGDTRGSKGAELLALPGSVYEEYVCTLPPPTTPPPTVPPSDTFCSTPDEYAFERVMGLIPKTKPNSVTDVTSSSFPTKACLDECRSLDDECLTVVIKYAILRGQRNVSCNIYKTAINCDLRNFVYCPSAAFYAKICIKGIKCSSLWTVERVPGYALIGFDFRRLQNVTSIGECAEKCLRERMCLSMQYFPDANICRLSTETRRSQPNAFRGLRINAQSLDNQCIKENAVCRFRNFPNREFLIIDKTIPTIANLSICQSMCNSEKDFMCRSLNYDSRTRTCSLSACDPKCFPRRVSYVMTKPGSTFSICSLSFIRRPSVAPRIK